MPRKVIRQPYESGYWAHPITFKDHHRDEVRKLLEKALKKTLDEERYLLFVEELELLAGEIKAAREHAATYPSVPEQRAGMRDLLAAIDEVLATRSAPAADRALAAKRLRGAWALRPGVPEDAHVFTALYYAGLPTKLDPEAGDEQLKAQRDAIAGRCEATQPGGAAKLRAFRADRIPLFEIGRLAALARGIGVSVSGTTSGYSNHEKDEDVSALRALLAAIDKVLATRGASAAERDLAAERLRQQSALQSGVPEKVLRHAGLPTHIDPGAAESRLRAQRAAIAEHLEATKQVGKSPFAQLLELVMYNADVPINQKTGELPVRSWIRAYLENPGVRRQFEREDGDRKRSA